MFLLEIQSKITLNKNGRMCYFLSEIELAYAWDFEIKSAKNLFSTIVKGSFLLFKACL